MEEIKLKVNGPFHWDELNSDDFTGNETFGQHYGFYVWGFVYSTDNDKILDSIDFRQTKKEYSHDKMRFIPYYVGRSQNDKKPIKGRLNDHYSRIKNRNARYICFTEEFMKEFFKNSSGYPIHKNNQFILNNFHTLIDLKDNFNRHKIRYHNNAKILDSIWEGNVTNKDLNKSCLKYANFHLAQPEFICKCSNCRRNKKNGNPIKSLIHKNYNQKKFLELLDTLYNLVNRGNFWVYSITLESEIKIEFRPELIENYIYYSLKGKTTSISEGHCPEPNKIKWKDSLGVHRETKIKLNINGDKASIFDNKPSYDFPGYI